MKRYRISNVRMPIDGSTEELRKQIAKKLGFAYSEISGIEMRRRSVDARDKNDVHFVCTVDMLTERKIREKSYGGMSVSQVLPDELLPEPECGSEKLRGRPIVVGMGPCGIFAGLWLARRGYRPLIIERGPAMEDRIQDVERFRSTGLLNPEGNMLFGEGGAGTFSDGKLGTGIKDGNVRRVLEEFALAGAGDDILYLNKPHIGTDVLRTVIVEMRKSIEAAGGEVRFNTRLEAVRSSDGELTAVDIVSNPGIGCSCDRDSIETIECSALILAIGHSARDTFKMISESGLSMEQKPFSVGVRMEHPQALIDMAQYGSRAIEKYGSLLPTADYKLSYKASNGRGVYSFCMCPGGEVVVCSNAEGELCVNGMSNRGRDSGTANSGILCDVRCEDYNNGDAGDVLAGVRYQEKYERLAYENGLAQHGRKFIAPSCRMAEFLNGADACENESGSDAAYVIGSLPKYAAEAIREAACDFARKIAGYDSPDAVIKAVETRSSSPVRILRDKQGESNIRGIYPAGEGAGYAGGITSAACDGIRAANRIIGKYKPL